MTKPNELKRRCRVILDTEDEIMRSRKKIELRRWIKEKKPHITWIMIDEMDNEELGIYMISGASGNFYNYALKRRGDMKDDPLKKAKGQPPDKTPASSKDPTYDDLQIFYDLPDDAIVRMVRQTERKGLEDLRGAIDKRLEKMPLEDDPATG